MDSVCRDTDVETRRLLLYSRQISVEVSTLLSDNADLGVLNVKNSGDWAMEKWSIRNKKDYAARHGSLDVVLC